jgi:hypothetical protein
MDPEEQQRRIVERVIGIMWFFLYLFGASAALGVLFLRAQYPNWELFMQLGFVGGAAAMVTTGVLKLAQAFIGDEQPVLQRLSHVTGFFVGILGALLTLGVLFEILQYPNADFFLRTGLLGGAAAFVAAGALKLGELNAQDIPDEPDEDDKVELGRYDR